MQDLLSLEERIGHVNTGLTEETIMNKLKTKTHLSSAITTDVEEETDLCIICQVREYPCIFFLQQFFYLIYWKHFTLLDSTG